MNLQAEIDKNKQQTLAKVSAETLQTMQQATLSLKQSGIENNALKAGDIAPDFNLPNVEGISVNLKQALQKGPVVLNIYRGGWCPYCNLELKALAEALPDIQATGAQLIAIAPQLPERSEQTVKKHELQFEVLSDVGNKVSRQYGLVLTVPESLRPIYKQFNLDIPGYNGDQTFELPMPATYIVKSNGVIAFAFANVDHTVRMEPSEIVKILKSL